MRTTISCLVATAGLLLGAPVAAQPAMTQDLPDHVTGPVPPPQVQPTGELGLVHLEASDEVELETQHNGQWVTVCRAPCNRPLPMNGDYRISGSGIRTSAPFRLQRGGTNLMVETTSSALHGVSVAITVVGAVGAAPAVGVTGILVMGMFFGFALICPIVDGVSSTSYGECLGDVGAYFGSWYAYPGVWIPGVAGAALVTGGIVGMAATPRSTVTALPSGPVGARSFPARRPEWHMEDPLRAVGTRPVTFPVFRYAF